MNHGNVLLSKDCNHTAFLSGEPVRTTYDKLGGGADTIFGVVFLMCIFVNCICLACIVVILCVFVVLCVYCCSYFRCRTAG
jgi:uncharacterized membrane protein